MTLERTVKGLLGTKLGMTQLWDENNRVVPVTVVKAGPNVVTRIRTPERDGYSAVQLAYGEISPRKVNKPVTGQYAAAGVNPRRHLAELRLDDEAAAAEYEVGQQVTAEIFADGDRTCALRRTGAVVCWGRGAAGEIGDGDSVDRYAPVPVIGLSNVTSVATGPNHACAMGADVRCWGANFYGQAGDGTTNSPRATAGPVSGFSGRVLTASLGVNHSCLLKGDGSAVCWGDNTNKQLGASGAPPGNQLAPVNVSLFSGATTAVSGVLHTCALLPEGTVKCWGRNLEYQLGTGDDTPSDVPIPVLFLDVYP